MQARKPFRPRLVILLIIVFAALSLYRMVWVPRYETTSSSSSSSSAHGTASGGSLPEGVAGAASEQHGGTNAVVPHGTQRTGFWDMLSDVPVLSLLFPGNGASDAVDDGSAGGELIHLSGPTMGATYAVKVVAAPETELVAQRNSILHMVSTQLDEVDRLMSTYKPDSELMFFNQTDVNISFLLSPPTYDVLKAALWLGQVSDGAFDITVAPMVDRWGFGAKQAPSAAPTDAEILALRQRVGYQHLIVDDEQKTVRKMVPNMQCDLSAIAPGYAADQIAARLQATGYQNFMVDVGGELRIHGHNANGAPWRIAVQRPDAAVGVAQSVIQISAGAVATSGDYRNVLIKDGKQISHTIDPRTGRPVDIGLASVTVVHPNSAMLADGFATAFMVLGPDKAMALAQTHALALMLILRDPQGALSVRANPAFEALTVQR